MGKGGGGGNTQQSTTTTAPWGPLAPYLREYMDLLNFETTGSYGAQKASQDPTLQQTLPNQQVAGFTPGQMEGLNLEYGAIPGQQMVGNTAADQTANILSGGMLNPASNPWLTQYYNAAAQPLMTNYMAATAPAAMSNAELAGAFGGSADAENRALSQYNFGNQLSNLAANIFEPAYQQGQQQLTQTLALSPSIQQGLTTPGATALSAGGLQQTQQQNELNAAYQNALWPYQELSYLGSGLTGLLPAGGTTTSTYPNPYMNSGLATGIGAGVAGLGLGASLFPNAFSNIGSSLASYLPFFTAGA